MVRDRGEKYETAVQRLPENVQEALVEHGCIDVAVQAAENADKLNKAECVTTIVAQAGLLVAKDKKLQEAAEATAAAEAQVQELVENQRTAVASDKNTLSQAKKDKITNTAIALYLGRNWPS